MKGKRPQVIYWDTSAILSALLKDDNSEQAKKYIDLDAVHLISSLALAETYAVVTRLRRDRLLTDVLVETVCEILVTGPWRQLKIGPGIVEIKTLAIKWPLRGADLWHLATAKTLQSELPELLLLTFDKKLHSAASGEDLSPSDCLL